MADDPERRHLIDPRYVSWDAFEERGREIRSRFERNERQAELDQAKTAQALAEQAAEIVRIRIAMARQAVYISLAQATITLVATVWVTYWVGHH